jgi:hypothetical protein
MKKEGNQKFTKCEYTIARKICKSKEKMLDKLTIADIVDNCETCHSNTTKIRNMACMISRRQGLLTVLHLTI